MNKKTVAVIFGGRSPEHEVSLLSAATIISYIKQDKYYVLPVGITREGKWMIYNGPVENIRNGEWEKFSTPAIISPDISCHGIMKIVGNRIKQIPVDIVFPALHGSFGEDGTIQGLFEMAALPYAGCGVLASAICMDKAFTKIIAKNAHIAQAKYICIKAGELEKINPVVSKIEKKFEYPCFIKPANTGSSVGITKAHDRQELISGLKEAAKYDRKILVEEFIKGREIEAAVLGNDKVYAATVGEIFAGAEFYDYNAKYKSNQSKTVVPADIPEEKIEEIKKTAIKIFKAVDGEGFARVDFFLEEGTNKVVFNEINTIPGFTAISLYPKLWEAVGKPIDELIDDILDLAASRNTKR